MVVEAGGYALLVAEAMYCRLWMVVMKAICCCLGILYVAGCGGYVLLVVEPICC